MFITHAGAELYTVDFGSGPATLVAHGGWIGSWELWAEPFSYLSKHWRTVAYDHRGTGATVTDPDSITHEALVGDLVAVLDTLAIERCVLAAESAGAAVALSAALAHPDRFEGLVLVDGLYHRPLADAPNPFVRALKADYQGTLGAFVDACVPETEPNSAAIRRWGRQILERAPLAAAVRLQESLNGLDLRPHAAVISQPTLILHGDADVIVPLSSSEWLAREIPHSRLHVVKGAGHVPTMTRPAEVAGVIDEFFRQG